MNEEKEPSTLERRSLGDGSGQADGMSKKAKYGWTAAGLVAVTLVGWGVLFRL